MSLIVEVPKWANTYSDVGPGQENQRHRGDYLHGATIMLHYEIERLSGD